MTEGIGACQHTEPHKIQQQSSRKCGIGVVTNHSAQGISSVDYLLLHTSYIIFKFCRQLNLIFGTCPSTFLILQKECIQEANESINVKTYRKIKYFG